MENPNYHLDNIVKEKNELVNFEGPLSLILMLLSKEKIAIRDLKISDILDQYIAYVEKMQEMDLEVASEFVQMASYLLYIKTKTLLAGDKEVSELEELIESLERLKASDVSEQIKQVVPMIKNAAETGLLYFQKQPEPIKPQNVEYQYSHKPSELLGAILNLFANSNQPQDLSVIQKAIPHKVVFNIETKSGQIIGRLKKSDMLLSELYRSCSSKSEIVAAFLSILELCSHGNISMCFEDSGDITIHLIDEKLDNIEGSEF